ncbi:MAG: DUF1648 domain-containing protein [Deltaproteobacteria bacterium]|nr:DUF1648 domain-containing protein [Deltaproteobacteria bacterium]
MTDPQRTPPLRTSGMRMAAAVTFAIWLGHAVFAWLAASRLPERYPVHFNLAGQPDRWAVRGDFEWYLLVLMGGVFGLGLTLLGLFFHRLPLRTINVPGKRQLLALSPERRAPVLRVAAWMVLLLGLLIVAMFASIQYAMYRSAHAGRVDALLFVVLGLEAASLLALVVGSLVVMRRRLRDVLGGSS